MHRSKERNAVKKLATILAGLTLVALFTSAPAQAQSQAPTASANNTTEKSEDEPTRPSNTEFDFVDSRDGYWVNRGFNDMMFGANGGVLNEAHIERDHDRQERSLRKIYRPPTLAQVVIKNKKPVAPSLTINGKVIEVK